MLCFWTIWPSGSMYKAKRRGPRTEPWGTPDEIWAWDEKHLPKLTDKSSVLNVRCKPIQSRSWSLCKRMSWSTVSNETHIFLFFELENSSLVEYVYRNWMIWIREIKLNVIHDWLCTTEVIIYLTLYTHLPAKVNTSIELKVLSNCDMINQWDGRSAPTVRGGYSIDINSRIISSLIISSV